MGWHVKKTGKPLAHVSHTWTLTHEDLARLIIVNLLPVTSEDLAKKRTKKELEEAVRDQLSSNADKRNWWMDEYADEYGNEATQDQVWEWGLAMARKLTSMSGEVPDIPVVKP